MSLSLLGPFTAAYNDLPLNNFTNKVQALLVYLAVERERAHRREVLFTLLWPSMPGKSARHNLSQILYRLPRIFPDVVDKEGNVIPLLLVGRQTIQLNPAAAVWVDIHQLDILLDSTQTHSHTNLAACPTCLDALEAALVLYKGDFLADFYLKDSNEFEDWAEAVREAYRCKGIEIFSTLADISIQNGDYQQAISYIDRQLASDELHERAHRQKIELLALSGRRVEAMRQYRAFERELEEQFGTIPSQDTTELYERIRVEDLTPSSPPLLEDEPSFQLTLYLFGPPRLHLENKPVHIPRRKATALLAYLAVTGQSHSRDSLAALLWPENDHSSARAGLRRTLSVLNRKLGDGWLSTDRETVRLITNNDPATNKIFWLDIEDFQAKLETCKAHNHPSTVVCPDCLPFWEAAVELYSADFMAGFTLKDCPAYDEWQFFLAEELRSQLADALYRLSAHYADMKEYETAINHAHRWLALDPLREAAHRQLMSLFSQSGQRAAALRQYQNCHQVLSDELGVEPSESTLSLFQRIRDSHLISTLDKRPSNNLPVQLTPFIGREEELSQLDKMLKDPDIRLITIVGPGGMGKTRLAIACAHRHMEYTPNNVESHPFPDGVFFVPLASVAKADQILMEIAKALDLSFLHSESTDQARNTIDQQLLNFLSCKRMLLVLDNFEQLLEGVQTIIEIIHLAPEVRLLITSRQRLCLHGEQIFPIRGLTFPISVSNKDLSSYTAIRLFVNSARRTQPDFELEKENIIYLISICRMLGGMPLGLELAASWVALLSVQEIDAEIQRSIDFLETDWVDLPERHHSLSAVCEITWRLMSLSEQDIFARLSVFRGGFTFEAAEQVAKASIRDLRVLVSKSILDYDQMDGRYHIHPYLQQYGAGKLEGNLVVNSESHNHHSNYYCSQVRKHFHTRMEETPQIAFGGIDADFRNIQTGWDWAIQQNNLEDIDLAIDGICAYLDWYWRDEEGLEMCQSVLNMLARKQIDWLPEADISGDTALSLCLYAKALSWQGNFSLYFAPQKAAESLKQSIPIIDTLIEKGIDTRNVKIRTLFSQGLIAFHANDLPKAKSCFQESLSFCREISYQWMVTYNLLYLGNVARRMGAYHEAKVWYEQCLVESRTHNDRWGEIQSLSCLGLVSRDLLDHNDAKNLFEQCLELSTLYRDPFGVINALTALGSQALFLGQLETAIERFHEGLAITKEIDIPQRALPLRINLGIAQFLRGDLLRADSNNKEAIALSKTISIPHQISSTIHYAEYLTVKGAYSQSYKQSQIVKTLAQDSTPHKHLLGLLVQVIGWIALGKENYPEAHLQFNQCIDIYASIAEYNQAARSQAGMARAMIGLGNWQEAHQLLMEALSTAIKIQGYIPMVFCLPMALLMLVKEDPDLAIHVYQQVKSDPFLAKAQLFDDLVYQYLPNEITGIPGLEIKGGSQRREALWATAKLVLEKWTKE